MADVKEDVISKVTISTHVDSLTNALVKDLREICQECKGKASLYFEIINTDSTKTLLKAKNLQISAQNELMNYISSHEELEIKIN